MAEYNQVDPREKAIRNAMVRCSMHIYPCWRPFLSNVTDCSITPFWPQARKIVSLYLINGAKFQITLAQFLYQSIVVDEQYQQLSAAQIEIADEIARSPVVLDCICETDSPNALRRPNRFSIRGTAAESA